MKIKKPVVIVCLLFVNCITTLKINAQQEQLLRQKTLDYAYGKKFSKFGTLMLDSIGGLSILHSKQGASSYSEGIVDSNGIVIVPLKKYFRIIPFHSGITIVELNQGKNSKFGIIDKTGKSIGNSTYDEFYGYCRLGYTCHKTNDNWEYSGEVRMINEYDWNQIVSEGLLLVKKNKKWSFINLKGETIIPPEKYDEIKGF